MSHISSKEFSEIRKSVTKRRQEIFDEMEKKKSISKKQCQQWVEDICDLIIAYNPVLSLSHSSIQPLLKLVDINSTLNPNGEHIWPTTESSNSTVSVNVSLSPKPSNSLSSNGNENEVIVVNDDEEEIQTVAQTNASDGPTDTEDRDDGPAKDGLRYKGEIRGIDSLTNDDDWSQTPHTSRSPPKKPKNTRQTRSKTTKVTNNKNKDKESDDWSVGGRKLGGDTPAEDSSSMSAEEKRRIIREKTEQRLAQQNTRGAKGVVKLSTRAQPDINVVNDPKNKLQWKL